MKIKKFNLKTEKLDQFSSNDDFIFAKKGR